MMSSALAILLAICSSADTEVKWARKSGGGGCTHAQANQMNLAGVSVSVLTSEPYASC